MIITEMFGGITGDRSGCEQNITEMYCCMASGAVSAVIGTRRLGQARW
jgi:cobalamin synthase